MNKIRSRRGSSSVFLCMILSALVSICFAFIYSTMEYSLASRADALMRLSGDSLLSEYDLDILGEYGLFLLRGDDRQLSSKLRHYLGYTLDQEPDARTSEVRASGASFTVSDPSVLRSQILSFMKDGGALKLRLEADAAGGEDDSGSGASSQDPHAQAGRSLRHGPTIASLPSRQLPEQSLLEKAEALGGRLTAAADVASIFSDGTDQYLLTDYVLGTFNSALSRSHPEHFFLRETEYVLCGALTDRENLQKTERALRTLRLPSNLAHIYSDAAKRDALAAAAELIAPGPGGAAIQAVLATAWAYAESVNDARLLLQGARVPLVKDEASWATDLEHVLEDTGDGDGVLRPDVIKGLTYGQYLRILFFAEDPDLMTARILDLIQINMRKNVDGHFLIGECCTGITMDAVINGRRFSYEKLYERILYR
ncbi:MAG: hypothetical protein IJJ21_01560 [Firmicutes bacterium]|nr:hypothetical protein [Bacillota bacterium]